MGIIVDFAFPLIFNDFHLLETLVMFYAYTFVHRGMIGCLLWMQLCYLG
jgi:hypothetical protein